MADSQAIVDQVRALLVGRFGIDEAEVAPNKAFVADLGIDSLEIVELIGAMEEEFGMQIPDKDIDSLRTVADTVNYIQSNRP